MILLIASSRCGLGRMHWMEQKTILKWTSQPLFHSWALEPAEVRLRLSLAGLGPHRNSMEFKV
jgi:hypothetical protein